MKSSRYSRYAFAFLAALPFAACGSDPARSLKEINPVVYMHRYDSANWAVRVNQVQRVYKNVHDLLDFRRKDDYYAVWILIPDTVGTFQGKEIGTAVSQLDSSTIHRSDAFPSERVEIGGGWIHLKAMSIRGVNGKFQVVRVAKDPYVMSEWQEQLLEPLPPWTPDSMGR